MVILASLVGLDNVVWNNGRKLIACLTAWSILIRLSDEEGSERDVFLLLTTSFASSPPRNSQPHDRKDPRTSPLLLRGAWIFAGCFFAHPSPPLPALSPGGDVSGNSIWLRISTQNNMTHTQSQPAACCWTLLAGLENFCVPGPRCLSIFPSDGTYTTWRLHSSMKGLAMPSS